MTDSSDGRDKYTADQWAARSVARWRTLTAVAAVIMLAVLAWAPTKELLRPWRRVQAEYNRLAGEFGVSEVATKIRQVWIPEAGKADRCGTCHLGMAGERPLEARPPFDSHVPIPHPPEEYGCTYCHSGQGWATVAADAHGEDGTWPNPIYRLARTEAGCGTCHSGLTLPLPETVEDAADLVDEYGCSVCHESGVRGAESLSAIGLRGAPSDWVTRHRGLIPPDDAMSWVVEADDDDLATLNAWLATRVGAPRLTRGKMVFQNLGCLGCHRRGRIGGDVGPDLSGVGDRDVRQLGGESAGPGTEAEWIRRHLTDPQGLDPTSKMPPVAVDELDLESDLDDLITYLLSLRHEVIPATLTPPDRARVEAGLGRDLPTDGRGLFVSLCSACHGFYATGGDLDTYGLVTPMIGSRGYLATVTPRYLAASITRGRRGRYMPAWGPEGSGLTASEIDTIVDYLTSRGSKKKPFESLSGSPDRVRGRQAYEQRCAVCHSPAEAEGATFGSDLLAPGGVRHLSRRRLYAAIQNGWVEEGMPAFGFLRGAEIRDLIAFLQSRETGPAETEVERDGRHARFGRQVWVAKCDDCHGAYGEGGSGPMLNTGSYLEWASDGYLTARIRDHHGRAARQSIGTIPDQDVAALLDFVRGWSGRVSPASDRSVPDLEAAARGEPLYRARCTKCHGQAAEGATGPALANRDFLDLVSKPFLVMTILEGRKGSPMIAWRSSAEQPVSLSEAFDLADFILSLDPSRKASATDPRPVEGGTHIEGDTP